MQFKLVLRTLFSVVLVAVVQALVYHAKNAVLDTYGLGVPEKLVYVN